MSVDVKPRRVLVAARPPEAPELAAVFTHAALKGWQMLPAGTLEQARSLAQQQRCEALVVDECLYERAAPAAFGWLCRQRDLPVVLLSANEPETLALAYGAGVSLCLPRRQTLKHPPLLAAALHRTAQWSDECRAGLRTVETLSQCRRQVDRLVSLLLRPVPADGARQWLTQRQILERLQEEVCRSGRHGNVLSVAVGEVQAADADPDELADWTARSLAVAKRRCDIAGHYGLHGFLLLMVQTPKAGGLACCRRLQRHLDESCPPPDAPRGPARAFFGVSSFAADGATAHSLLHRAEKNLDAAKGGACGGIVGEGAAEVRSDPQPLLAGVIPEMYRA